jgi:hypothetical protein
MHIKSGENLKLKATVCQFMATVDVIEIVASGYPVRCMLKLSVDYPDVFVAEVWAYSPDSHQEELQGILVVEPDAAIGEDIHVLRGKTLETLKASMRQALPSNIYDLLIIEEIPSARPVRYGTEGNTVLDLAVQARNLHRRSSDQPG